MREHSLAELVPLWRTLREEGVTATVTPALDYVGALELTGLDVRFEKEETIASLGEALRRLVASLEDESTLLFLSRVQVAPTEEIAAYTSGRGNVEPEALRAYVASRAEWLKTQPLRGTRLFLFFSGEPFSKSTLNRGHLGLRLLFADPDTLSQQEHLRRLKALGGLRDRLAGRFAQLGIGARELSPEEVSSLHYQLLNPTRAREGLSPPEAEPTDLLWAEATVRQEGAHLREYSEAERICLESVRDARGYFQQGALYRRVCTLKVLPEGGTDYIASEPLLSLAAPATAGGAPEPFSYTLAVVVRVQPQGRTRWMLNARHGLVDALKHAIPFLADGSVAREEADRAQQESIGALFAELNELSSKLVTLSVSILLEATSLEVLDAQTEAARGAFNAAGNSELMVEDVAQVPALLSLLPGSGPYQLRKKTCTSRNAGDFLPVFAPWRGCSRPSSLFATPAGDGFRLDLFDEHYGTAHHGLVIAGTGAGKSVGLGALTLDALSTGVDAILVDNGNSWLPLTELMGGIHIPVDIKTSISPFLPYSAMLDESSHLSNEALQDVVHFIELCVTDRGLPGFDKLQADLVGRAVRRCYEVRFRERPDERPLISAFRDALAGYSSEHADDAAIAAMVSRRLAAFCDGVYADFLNRPSTLRFDARLLAFDLAKVSKDPVLKSIAMAAVMGAVTHRASQRRNRTLVEVDEAHEYLGQDDVGERFLASCYRKMRKFDVAMWCISQSFSDFAGCKAGPAIVDNSKTKIFLRHSGGHDAIASYFKLSPRAAQAFRELALKPGHYSDFLLLYGAKTSTVRLALHPLAYWILTTDPTDRRLIDKAAARNPSLDRLSVLQELAARYPHGAARPKHPGAPHG